jgi:hypothetical protein
MIAFNRVVGIAPGKTASAIGFAHEIAAYFKSSYGVDLEVLLPIGGNPQRIAWSARYKDLAQMDAVQQKMLQDQQYLAMVGKGVENFVGGSMHDTIWRTL